MNGYIAGNFETAVQPRFSLDSTPVCRDTGPVRARLTLAQTTDTDYSDVLTAATDTVVYYTSQPACCKVHEEYTQDSITEVTEHNDH